MRIEPDDLLVLAGGDGKRFEAVVRDLVVNEAKRCGISPTDIDWDYRTNCPDGGCDIYVKRGAPPHVRRLLPNKPSIWSIKSGDDGERPDKLEHELIAEKHERLRQHLRDGHNYVWCALKPISQPKRKEMYKKRAELAADKSFREDQIIFVWNDALQVILDDYLNLIAKHLPHVAERFQGICTLRQWQRESRDRRGFEVDWVPIPGRDQVKDRVRLHLSAREGSAILHIAGLSGVGKTRTVLQACLDDDALCDTLYAPQLSVITDAFFRHIEEEDRETRLVIDEVQLSDYAGILPRFDELGDRLRIITIGPARRREHTRRHVIVLDEPETDAGVLKVVEQAGIGLSEAVTQSIAAISAHDLRLALLLVFATKNDPKLRTVPVRDHDDVWQRVTSLFVSKLGDINTFAKRYRVLTTSVDVGWQGKYRLELEYLAGHFELSPVDLDDAITGADRCGLGIRTPQFFEASPRALATWFFYDRLWPILEPRLDQFLENMPSERLRRRFIERCHDLQGRDREEVMGRVSSFFRTHLGEPTLASLIDRESSRVFQSWAEFDPEQGLAWLREATAHASSSDLAALDGASDGSGGWRGRRQVVWLCEHLACFSEYFWDCEEILLRLAQVETEQSIANNSRNTWRSLFLPILSFTEVPFARRLAKLLGRLDEANDQSMDLILAACFDILDGEHARPIPPRVVGGRIVPDEWRPTTVGELVQLRQDAGRQVLAHCAELENDLRSKAARSVVGHFDSFAGLGLASDLHGFFTQEDLAGDLGRQLRGAIDDFVSWEESHAEMPEEMLAELRQWRDLIQPTGLAAEIKDLTSRDYWSVERVHRPDDDSEESQFTVYPDSARRLLEQPEVVRELEEWFGSGDCRSSTSLAFHLGREDEGDVLYELMLDWLTGPADEFASEYLRGYVVRVRELPESAREILDEIGETRPFACVRTTLGADIGGSGFRRIINCVDALEPAQRRILHHMAYSEWNESLTDGQKLELFETLRRISDCGDPFALAIAFDLLNGWCCQKDQELPGSLREEAKSLVLSSQRAGAQVDDYAWKQVLESLLPVEPTFVATVLSKTLAELDGRRYGRARYAEKLLLEAGRHFPNEVMNSLGNVVMDRKLGVMFRVWVFRGIFDAIGLSHVRPWVQQNGHTAAIRIARHLEGPFLDDQGQPIVPELADWLLQEFSDEGDVFQEFCMGRHSGEMRRGSASDHAPELHKLTKPFIDHQSPWVRAWAQYELDNLKHEMEWDEQRDDELDRT